MIKHVIIWNLDEKLNESEKETIKENIKINLEGLIGKIPGMTEIKVITNGLTSSTGDLMLNSAFESEEALKNYAKNPLHNEVADKFVRPYTSQRSCYDFEV